MRSRPLVLALFAVAACGDNTSTTTPDAAARDAAVDAFIDPMCGTDRYVTGELVDLDSTPAAFAGVNGAIFTAQVGGATATTAPNGRFELCTTPADPLLFDVDAPGDRLDGVAYLEAEAPSSMAQPISFRSLTLTRAASFYAEHGLVFDATKAHVLVFLAGDRSELTLDRTHGTTLAASEDAGGAFTWAAGTAGRYLLFPNVDVAAATGTLTGDTSGAHTIPLQAGKLTLVALWWVFL